MEPTLFDDLNGLLDSLDIKRYYPLDDLWTPETQEMILNEIKTDLTLYAFPSAVLSYFNLENRICELLEINQLELKLYLEKNFLFQLFVLEFIANLPRNIRKIEQHNDTISSVETNKISGRINWPLTLKTGFNTPRYFSKFYIHSNKKTYDTPGNRVLGESVFLLFRITKDIIKYFGLTFKKNGGWNKRVFEINKILEQSHKNLKRRFARTPPILNDYITTLKKKKDFYRTAAHIVLELKNFENSEFLLQSWTDFFLTAPENLDRLYEICVLMRIVGGISAEFNTHPILFLQGPQENRFIATFNIESTQIFVYYQKNPFKSSIYANTLKKYGLKLKKRIPDICIKISKDGEEQNIFVEVKRTRNLNYIRSAIYKTLGYFSDFSSEENLHAFLVVWSLPNKEDNEFNYPYLPIFSYKSLNKLVDSINGLLDINGVRTA